MILGQKGKREGRKNLRGSNSPKKKGKKGKKGGKGGQERGGGRNAAHLIARRKKGKKEPSSQFPTKKKGREGFTKGKKKKKAGFPPPFLTREVGEEKGRKGEEGDLLFNSRTERSEKRKRRK